MSDFVNIPRSPDCQRYPLKLIPASGIKICILESRNRRQQPNYQPETEWKTTLLQRFSLPNDLSAFFLTQNCPYIPASQDSAISLVTKHFCFVARRLRDLERALLRRGLGRMEKTPSPLAWRTYDQDNRGSVLNLMSQEDRFAMYKTFSQASSLATR